MLFFDFFDLVLFLLEFFSMRRVFRFFRLGLECLLLLDFLLFKRLLLLLYGIMDGLEDFELFFLFFG